MEPTFTRAVEATLLFGLPTSRLRISMQIFGSRRWFQADFALNPGKMVMNIVQLYPMGKAVCQIADSDVGGHKGQTMVIYVRDGDTWKRCMAFVGALPWP